MKTLPIITSLALAATIAASSAVADEASALAVLASDANTEQKVQACNELAVVGTAKAVPALAKLLADEQLNDYARTSLEVIKDPSAGQALLAALPNLKGRLLAGAVTSLGYCGDPAAVPALQKLAADPAGEAAEQALTSLAMIGGDEAVKTIIAVLKDGPAKCKVCAAHAALLGAERMKKAGKSPAALLDAIAAAEVPAHIKEAAAAMKG